VLTAPQVFIPALLQACWSVTPGRAMLLTCTGRSQPEAEMIASTSGAAINGSVMLNPRLQEIVDDFNAMPARSGCSCLLEFSQELPPLPDRYVEDRGLLEPVAGMPVTAFPGRRG